MKNADRPPADRPRATSLLMAGAWARCGAAVLPLALLWAAVAWALGPTP